MQRRILLISVNPWPRWIAVERALAKRFGREAVVDGLNLAPILGAVSPEWSIRDVFYERLLGNFDRFVRPFLSGKMIDPGIGAERYVVPPLPRTVEALRQYRIDGSAIGIASLSSATSLAGIADNVDIAPYGKMLDRAWRIAHLTHAIADRIGPDYDEVYIFNGRHSVSRPFCDRLARHSHIYRYEAGTAPETFLIWPDSMHDPNNFVAMIRRQDFDAEAGHEYYRSRAARAAGTDAHDFTQHQQLGFVPAVLSGKAFVTFFNSSPDEYFAIDDVYQFGSFQGQGAAALAVAQACQAQQKTLVIRLHPNLAHKHGSWRREWDFAHLRELGAIVIEPGDPCDSYALLKGSECVVSCGSTTGVEAAYWGVPSLSIGENPMTLLGATTRALNRADIERFLTVPWREPGAQAAALIYGSFFVKAGEPIPEFTQPGGAETARIAGHLVDPIRFATAWTRRLAGRFRHILEPSA